MAPRARHDRLPSDTRMDVVTMMLTGKSQPPSISKSILESFKTSPCDSLSPLDDQYSQRVRERAAAFGGAAPRKVTGRDAFPKQQQEAPCSAFPHLPQQHAASTPVAATDACSPRSPAKQHLPASLNLHSTNGYTALRTADLKQRICDARTDDHATLTQVPIDKQQRLPPTPTTPFTIMGNKPSSLSGTPIPDDKSLNSVVRRSARQPVSRKSSFNVFKRVDSKSPLPRDVTASVMSILHRDGHHKKDDSTAVESDTAVSVPTDPFFDQPDVYDGRYPDMYSKVHSASTITMTDDRAGMPLSAATTIRDYRSTDRSLVEDSQTDGACDLKDLPPLPGEDALLPTIPAPSPLPEDSPHKYGLRDQIDTPEIPEQPPAEINVTKMRRKSSGLEIFNEAKTLQSAQSFLNGLSTARRRAESAADMRTTGISDSAYTTTTSATSRPPSTRPFSARPKVTYQDGEGRRKGHNFKSSGFAYTRPLTLAQMKCYRGHSRLLVNRNKYAPVECAVCHIDDEAEHYSCSWCAIRMCRYCRKDFAERGMSALRERIKTAELGGSTDSANSSRDNLHGLRKMKSSSFA